MYRGGNGSENEASLASIRGQKEGRPDWRLIGRDPQDLPEIMDQSLGINGS